MSKLNMSYIILALFCFCLVIVFIGWLLAKSGPIIYSYRNSASASMGPSFIIFNPLRDKNPELAAEEMLNQIRKGDCKRAIADLILAPSAYSKICERESVYKLEDWSLADRRDFGNTSKLYYHTSRQGFSGYAGWVSIEMRKIDDRWKPITADFIY